jgi:lipoate-protein ligase A
MAVDEAILTLVGQRQSPPTLRLYAWQPACLSLGQAQPAADADRAALILAGWDLVRRPTGGRAILHADEITYAIIASESEKAVQGGVIESYRHLSQALLATLERLQVGAQANQKYDLSGSGGRFNPVCFEVPSDYEVTVHGKKLIGSAQVRRMNAVLQHGTLPLHGDLTRILQALAFADEPARQAARQRLLDHAVTLEGALGQVIDWETAAQAFQAAFSQTLAIELLSADLTPAEAELAQRLVDEKYANPAWTERV